MQRYFINEDKNEISFTEEQLHHILKVMRMNIGEELEVVFHNHCYIMKIISLNPFNVEKVDEIKNSPELNVNLTLFYCLPKGDKLDLVIQKATEIGAKEIVLVESSRCVSKFKKEDYPKKLARFNKIALEASEQSHRFCIPTIKDIIPFKDIAKYHFTYSYIAYENERNGTFIEDLKNAKKGDSVAIIVGSEGGFSEEEVAYAFKNKYVPVTLGKRILRSETAALYALSVISYLVEDK